MKKFIYLFFFVILSFEVLFVFAQKKDSTVFEKNNNQKLTKQQKEAMNLALLNARKYIANHQWDEAEDSYKLALKYDSTNLNNYLEFVSYLKERNGYRGILSLSEKLLPVYKKQAANDRFMQKSSAIILEFMGESHFSRGDTNQAKKEFKEALEILDRLSEKDPQFFLVEAAGAQKKLGIFYSKINDFEKAQAFLNTSLNNADKSAKWNAASSRCEKTSVNISLGNMYYANNDFEKAKSFYAKALEINDTSSVDCLNPYPDNVAVAKRGLARTYQQLHDSLNAERFFKEAIEFYERFILISPEHYIDKIISSLEELMKFYNYEVSSANFYWNEKLFRYNLLYYKIYHLEDDYKSDIADLYNEFGNSCVEINEFDKADSIYIHALQLYRKRSQYEEDYKTKLVIVLTNLGLVHDDLKDYINSELYRLEALNLCESVYKESSDMNADICLFTQRDLIGLYLTLMDSLRSDSILLKFKQRTESLYDQMQKKCTEPNNNFLWEPCHPKVCGSLSYYLLFLKKFPESEMSARWALEKDDTQTWIKINLAHALLFQNKYDEAEKIYQELKASKDINGVNFVHSILKDFDQLEKNGITSRDVNKIRKLLEK